MKKAMAYILMTALLFTTLEPVSKLIAADVSPLVITLLRFLIGSLVMLPFAIHRLRSGGTRLTAADCLQMALLGVLCICVSMVLLQYAVQQADSPALIAIVFSSTSVFTVLLSVVILKDKLTPVKGVGVVLCLGGVLLSADLSAGTNALSITLAVAAALAFSLYTVLSKRMVAKVGGLVNTSFSFLFGSLVLAVALLLMGVPMTEGVAPGNLWVLLYLGVAITGVGYWTYFRAMDVSSAMAASLVFFIKPVLTPLAAFVINGIVPDTKVFLALALVLAGSILATRGDKLRLPWRGRGAA